MENNVCPFCDVKLHQPTIKRLSVEYYCPNCGWFSLPYYVVHDTEGLENWLKVNDKSNLYDKRHLISGFLYEFNRNKFEIIQINSIEDLEQLLNDGRIPKTPMQRMERLLLRVYEDTETNGFKFIAKEIVMHGDLNHGRSSQVRFRTMTNRPAKLSTNYKPVMAYARDEAELALMLRSLKELGFLGASEFVADNGGIEHNYFIAGKGLERAEQLLSGNVDSKTVFVAMDFGNDERENGGSRKEQSEIFDDAIKPACEALGFNATRIDYKPHINGITDEIIVEIKKSKFVIADLTYNNNGAYWEAGYAQGLGRPVIYCCNSEWLEKGGKLHFDISHIRQIRWTNLEDFQEQLKATIGANFK